ncbi:polysaccharide biosynthesis protein [Desulfosarcina ovata subsp. sediminis]|uniref:Polysaccharide biosynthesis protein n=1 Tax=Desulfosarcina ovata subsp. sediminis TaxID=885957 RepID=A0A5K7ZK00_9BACT|nr:CpsD/CapB family tyrosine-protein kinase [Desulfosarcina ovata]BBO81356.1 polysaccharide biosynthesis protein [Desulfosarcina ovata subsp. sediminis]
MGKIHEALEKSGRAKDMKVAATLSQPHPARQANSEIEIKVVPKTKSAEKQPEAIVPEHKLDPHLVAYHSPAGVEAEIFKILRTNILFPKTGAPPRSIMVTSAIPGDGKSFVAANLAISIAQGIEDHVLLMDCDMRRSSIHKSFGFTDNTPGLSDYLDRKQPLESLLKKTVVDKLTILPGGPQPTNPSELLSSQAMKALLKEARSRYNDRYIIVDTPPPQLTAETTALANYIDGIILVIRYASTPKDMIKELIEKLGKEKIIGVVMNDYRIPTTERYGYGKYKKYKKY